MWTEFVTAFHFLRPWWLLGLVPLVLMLFKLWRRGTNQSGWRLMLPEHLARELVDGQTSTRLNQGKSVSPKWLPLALILITVGLAGPTWQRLPEPVYQLDAGSVLVLDMSTSMYSTDLEPNRLTQLRFKAMELATNYLDGDIGLIAYAADAYVISPLTPDPQNLTNLIRALSPELMPAQGSYPARALQLADRLLRDAGYPQGDIYWFTDGIDPRDQTELAQLVQQSPHRISVLGIGTENGAPIRLPDGKLLREPSGDVVVPRLEMQRLTSVAERSGGVAVKWRQDLQDIQALVSQPPLTRDAKDGAEQQGDTWRDYGIWLVLLGILLLLPYTRKGALPVALFVPMLTLQLSLMPSPAVAQSANSQAAEEDTGLAWHQQLWQTPYQQADQALINENYERAAQLSESPWQRGTAQYRAGQYEAALQSFSQMDNAEGLYNAGNALMQMQRYDEAQQSYQLALERRPDWPEAQENAALAKQLAQQQKQQQQQQQSGQNQQQQNADQNQQQDGDSQSQMNQDNSPQDAPPDTSETQQNQQQQGRQPQPDEAEQKQQADDAAEQQKGEQRQQTSQAQQLSEEQRQQLEQWLNRIEDNPAVLLRNKMLLEAQRRAQQNPPRGVQKQW